MTSGRSAGQAFFRRFRFFFLVLFLVLLFVLVLFFAFLVLVVLFLFVVLVILDAEVFTVPTAFAVATKVRAIAAGLVPTRTSQPPNTRARSVTRVASEPSLPSFSHSSENANSVIAWIS
ncbi:hypothetical protein C7E19_07530 [Stenotrophomonas maltophilia]|nr:hypothetical protein C7E19_07530 [Stenotrophomonas maltophilia]